MYPFGFESHYISQKAPSLILLCLSLYLPSKPSQLLYPFSSLHAVTNTHIRHDNSPSLYCKMQPHSTASRSYLVSLILLHNLHSIAWQTPNIFTSSGCLPKPCLICLLYEQPIILFFILVSKWGRRNFNPIKL